MFRRYVVRTLVLASLILLVLGVRPVHDGILRWGSLVGGSVIWAALLVLARPVQRGMLALLPVLTVLPFFLPARPLDRDRLRASYLAGMRECEGVRYVWGGESRWGIDCSGLPRRAWRQALLEQAWEGNGTAFRAWAEQWWYDASARAIGAGYRHLTIPFGTETPMSELPSAELQPGDLAVTQDGRHVMVHLEGGEWIQADPTAGEVFRFFPEDQANPWRDSRVILCRWTLLADGPSDPG